MLVATGVLIAASSRRQPGQRQGLQHATCRKVRAAVVGHQPRAVLPMCRPGGHTPALRGHVDCTAFTCTRCAFRPGRDRAMAGFRAAPTCSLGTRACRAEAPSPSPPCRPLTRLPCCRRLRLLLLLLLPPPP
eukprot:scaffold2284_cov402-Prasinococcus_capsulatus_cf.AAC.21